VRFGWPYTGIANRLRRHPAEVQQLTRFRTAGGRSEAAFPAAPAPAAERSRTCKEASTLRSTSAASGVARGDGRGGGSRVETTQAPRIRGTFRARTACTLARESIHSARRARMGSTRAARAAG
jgi:hypothetical protein